MRSSSRNASESNGLLSKYLPQLSSALERVNRSRYELLRRASRSRRLPQWIRIAFTSIQRPVSIQAVVHREETKRMPGARPSQTTWHLRCSCGWMSRERHSTSDMEQCHEEYRTHVIESIGEGMAYYTAVVVCMNCSYKGKAQAVVGQAIEQGACPNCNVRGGMRSQELCDTHETPLFAL